MTFEYDVLISYAHLDDQALIDGEPGWVTRLHQLLEIRISQLHGEKPRIWRDPKLQGNEDFSDTILARLPKTGALVSVLSPRYLKSEWCNRELGEFFRASEKSGGIRVGDKARIFKVLKRPIPLEKTPEEVRPFLGYDFFEIDPQSGRPREISEAYGPEGMRAFLAKVDDLAYDIVQLLETLNANGGDAEPESPKSTVFLAETSADLRSERDAIRRDLIRNGHLVLPDQPLPRFAGPFEHYVRQQLERSDLSVHMIGGTVGPIPGGGDLSAVAMQQELAAAHSAEHGLSRLIWLPPGQEVKEEAQRDLIEHLRSSPGVHEAAEVLEVSLEDLKTRIYSKLAPPEEATKETVAPTPSKAAGLIYIVCDQEDVEAARAIEGFLFDRGFEVALTLFAADEAEARQDHEENLCICDAVLVYYGTVGEGWVRRKLREIRKSSGLGRERTLAASGIYLAAPATESKDRLRSREAAILREPAEGFSPEVLAPFLTAIEKARQVES